MKYRFLLAVLMVLVVAVSSRAQTKMSGSGTCGKPDVEHSIPVPDSPGQSYSVSQSKCTFTKPWEMAGLQTKGGVGTSANETSGNSMRQHETFVETFANGDMAFYHYEATVPLKNGAPQPHKGKWTLLRGTGKLKGVKATGTCSITPAADGSIAFECEGEYTLPEAKPAKK